ncbi:MAG: hypothetical protein Q9194_002030 [Teloschistes cf. exilis]
MSHYINSFLIEPVVRQARRFSRPSLESLPSHPANHALSSPDSLGETLPEGSGLGNTTLPSIAGQHGPNLATSVAAELNDITLHLENGILEVESHSASLREDSESPWEEVSIYRAPPGAVSGDEHMSNNPGHGVTESLRSRSTTSSVSAHAQRDRDVDNMDTLGVVNPRRYDSHGANRGNNVTRKERTLPADDGMGLMRKRIVAIQRTDSSSAEKARLIHGLMTEHSIPDHATQVPELSQHAYARGRLPEVVAPSRAATFSAPPSSEPLAADGSERRCVRSQDPNATSRLPQSPTLVTTSDDGSATESESNEEDLDFWGQRSPVIRAVTTGPQEESMSSDGEVDDESQDESDEDAVIYDDDDGGTDDSEADGEEEDLMEIYGHR